jgi:hypothetical protein
MLDSLLYDPLVSDFLHCVNLSYYHPNCVLSRLHHKCHVILVGFARALPYTTRFIFGFTMKPELV